MSVVTDVSSIYFVYPFRFEPSRFPDLNRRISAATTAWQGEDVSVWDEAPLPVGDMIPRAAALFQATDDRAAALWRLRGAAREPFGATEEVQWSLHLKGRRLPFRLGPDGPRSEGMHGGALLALFRSGVGFLTVSASPRADDLGTWLDFLHYFRLQAQDARPVSARASDRDFCPPGAPAADAWPFIEVISALLRTADPSTWWTETAGRLMPYSVVFLDGEPEESQPTALYQVRSCFHRNLGRQASPVDLAPSHPALLSYSRRQWFATGFESAAFVAFDAPDDAFFRKRLPVELSEVYFIVFLYALYQRATLGVLAERLAAPDDDGEGFERLLGEVLSYTSRGHLAQVAHDAYPHLLYARLRSAFQVETMFDDLNAEVRARHDLLSTRHRRSAERFAAEERARHQEHEAQRAAHVALLEQQRADQQAQGERLLAHLEGQSRAAEERFDHARGLVDQRAADLVEAVKGQAASLERQRDDLQSHVDLVIGQVGQQAERLAEAVKQQSVPIAEAVRQQSERITEEVKRAAEQAAEQSKLLVERLTEQAKTSAEQAEGQAKHVAEQVAKLVALHAEQAKQHTDLVTRLGEQHAEQLAKVVEQYAEQAKQHAEQLARLGEQQAQHLARLGEQHAERLGQARSLDRKVGVLALLIGVPVLVTSFLGINVSGWTTRADGISLVEAVGYTVGGLVVGGLLLWWLDRKPPASPGEGPK